MMSVMVVMMMMSMLTSRVASAIAGVEVWLSTVLALQLLFLVMLMFAL